MPKRIGLPSEKTLWSIIDHLPIAIYMKDVDCKFTYVNLQGVKNLGVGHADEVLGRTDADFFDADQAKDWIAQEKRIMASEENMIDQKELELWANGRHRWVLTSKIPLVASNGTLLGLFGMTRDITEWERINLAVAGAREGLWYRALNSNEVWYSPHWKEILGYTDEEMPNERDEFRKRVHPEDWPLVEKRYDAHIHGEAKHYECSFRMRHKDGRYRWIRSRGMMSRDESGKPQVFAGSHADVTESLDREDFYLKVLDTIPNLIFVRDKDLRFVFVNEAVARNFSQRKDEIIGKTDADVNPDKEQVARFVKDDTHVITNEEAIDIPEEVLTDAQGNERTLTAKKLPLIFPGTTETHVLSVATDITELKKVHEDLRKILSVLAEAVKDIEDSESEDVACESALLQLDRLGYQSVMLSFLREVDGIRTIVADSRYATGNFASVASRTRRPFDVPEAERDVLVTVLAGRKSRFIPDSALDAECDARLFKECGIVSQYVVSIATDSLKIGTLQIDLGSRKEMPEVACKMFDALAAHLSIVIERHRVLQRLEAVNNDLTNQARIIGFETAASVILHDLNHSIADYARLLTRAMKDTEVRQNKAALDFLKLTNKRISHWIDSVRTSVDEVRRNEEYGEHKVDDIVREIVNTWQHKANAQNRRLKGTYLARDAVVTIRAGTLKDLLSCLVINAFEAKAREIEVATQVTTQTDALGVPKYRVEIVVSDDGHGISEEFKEQIHEFGWSSKKKRGHGMGLTVVDLLAKSMGGSMNLRSCGKSAGEPMTRFVVYIPVLNYSLGV